MFRDRSGVVAALTASAILLITSLASPGAALANPRPSLPPDAESAAISVWHTPVNLIAAAMPAAIQTLATPQRLVDTRSSTGPIATGTSRCFQVGGSSGIPADAAGVVLNVAAVGYTTRGWLTLYPNGQSVPTTSTLNFDPAEYAIANGTIVRLGTGGQVCVGVGTINNSPGSAQVVVDVTGYIASSGQLQLPLLTQPLRLADTRSSTGPINTGTSRCFQIGGLGGIPADASGVVLNITAVGYATRGWLTLYPNGQGVPATSTLNFDPAEYAIANGTIVRLGTGGQVCVSVGTFNATPGSAEVVLDVTGYIASSGQLQMPLLTQPQRLVDTRNSSGPIATGTSRCFQIAGSGGIPANASGVVLNVAAVGYATQGWLSLYPNGQGVPATSTLNFDPGEYAIANGTIIRLGTAGQVCVNVGTINPARGSAQVVIDAVGYLP